MQTLFFSCLVLLQRRSGPLDPAVMQLQGGDIAEKNGKKDAAFFFFFLV